MRLPALLPRPRDLLVCEETAPSRSSDKSRLGKGARASASGFTIATNLPVIAVVVCLAVLHAADENAILRSAIAALQRKDVAAAMAEIGKLPASASYDPGLGFSLGVALANAAQYEPAERFFTRALAAAPNDFNILFNLGVVCAYAGHYDRAYDILSAALKQQPQNIELLYRLATVEYARHKPESAVQSLALAAKLAPERAEIQKLLAITTTDLGDLEDAVAAWDRYLKLTPSDDAAVRERAYTAVRMGRLEEGIAALRAVAKRHPDDAVAHFQLGVALAKDDPAQALAELDRAVALRRDFAPALSARGNLKYQQGKPEDAVADLEAAAKLMAHDPMTLDRLGQTYGALERPADAVRVLREAARLAPTDSTIQLHFGRALAQAGQTAESKAVMDRFRELGPAKKNGMPPGFVEYLAMSPEARKADFRARVEQAVKERPDDPAAQLEYLKLLLEDKKFAEAAAVGRRISPAGALRDAGRAMLEARQYAAANELLTKAGAEPGIARFRALDEAGKFDQAAALIERLAGQPQEGDFYWHAASVYLRNGRRAEAERLLSKAPDSPEVSVMRAAVLQLDGRPREAQAIAKGLQSQRPEWPAVWKVEHTEGLLQLFLDRPPRDW